MMFFRKRRQRDENRKEELQPRHQRVRLPPIAHAFAREKLEHCLTCLDYEDAIPRISNDLVEEGRILYQALPFRVYVYDLDNPLGTLEFELMCASARPSSEIIEVASIRVDSHFLGYYLYALGPVEGYPSRGLEPTPGLSYARFALDRDWDRLMKFSREHDVAYSIQWLRELYGQTARELIAVLTSARMSHELAEAMIFFNDETLHGLLERITAKLQDQAGMSLFNGLVDRWFLETGSQTSEASGKGAALRTNPLIAVMFAMQSPLFYAIAPRTFEQLCKDRFAQLGITSENISQLNDLFDYVLSCNPDAARSIAETTILAAASLGDREPLAYASYNLGAILAASDDPRDLQDAVTHLEGARELFLRLDSIRDSVIDVVDISLRRAIARLSGMTRRDPWGSLAEELRARLLEYNATAQSGDVDGAIRILDEVARAADHEDPVQIDLNSLAGQLLARDDRLNEAYKRLYRCENLIRDEHLHSESGFFEAFKCNLLYSAGNWREAADLAQEALDRIAHVCQLECLHVILISLSASLSDTGRGEEAIAHIEKYRLSFEGEDGVFLDSNLAYAMNQCGRYEEAMSVCEHAIEQFRPGFDSTLRFDVLSRLADAKLHLLQTGQVELQSVLQTFDEAEEYVPGVGAHKQSVFYLLKADLLDIQGASSGDAVLVWEEAFRKAETRFAEVARLADDIHDRDRLLSGLAIKVYSFVPFRRLFKVYSETEHWAKLYEFCQRFKAKFLVEAFFSNSETMVAGKVGEYVAQQLDGSGSASLLKRLQLMAVLLEVGGPGTLRPVLADQLVKEGEVEGTEVILPVSVEHLDEEMSLYASENLTRGEEIDKAVTSRFLDAQIREDVAVIEFFYMDATRLGAIAIQKNIEPRLVGYYEIAPDLVERPLFQLEQVSREIIAANNNAFQAAFKDFGGDLSRVLHKGIKQLVFCPTMWMLNLPLHAIRLDGQHYVGDLYTTVYAPSATIYALSLARRRKAHSGAVALVDPQSELVYSSPEAELLSACRQIKFGKIIRSPLKWDELKTLAKSAYWLHISAHGYPSKAYLGFDAGIRTGTKAEVNSPAKSRHVPNAEDLTAAYAFADCFPGIGTAVVVLSSCHSARVSELADEPIGVPTALLLGGAKAVLAPLWQVDEYSTLLFMEFLYRNLEGFTTLAAAVQAAARSLRGLKTSEVLDRLDCLPRTEVASPREIEAYRGYLADSFAPDDHPYQDPFFWAPFCVMGCDLGIGTAGS